MLEVGAAGASSLAEADVEGWTVAFPVEADTTMTLGDAAEEAAVEDTRSLALMKR